MDGCGNFVDGVVAVGQADDDHRDDQDDEELERQQHEVGPGELKPLRRPEVEHADDEAEDRACGQGEVGGTHRSALPEDAQQEDGSHRRRDEAEYRLEDVEEVETLDGVDGYGHGYGDDGTDDGHQAADVVDAPLRGIGAEALDVDVHGEDGGQGIESRADGADEAGGQDGEHEADHADGEEVLDHGEVGLVRIFEGGEQGEADDAWEDVESYVENLQPAREIGAQLALAQVFRGQHGLYHALVGTPEPHTHDGVAEDDGQPGEGLVGVGLEHHPVVGRNLGYQCRNAAHAVESDDDEHQRHDDEQYHLVDVGIGHGLQSAQHGEERRDDEKDERRHPHGNVEDLTDEDAAGKERQRQPRDDDGDDGVPRQDVSRGLSEAQAQMHIVPVPMCTSC